MNTRYVTIPCYDTDYVFTPEFYPKKKDRRFKLVVKRRNIIGYLVSSDGCKVLLSNGKGYQTRLTEKELLQYINGELMDSSLNYMDVEQEEYTKAYTMQR